MVGSSCVGSKYRKNSWRHHRPSCGKTATALVLRRSSKRLYIAVFRPDTQTAGMYLPESLKNAVTIRSETIKKKISKSFSIRLLLFPIFYSYTHKCDKKKKMFNRKLYVADTWTIQPHPRWPDLATVSVNFEAESVFSISVRERGHMTRASERQNTCDRPSANYTDRPRETFAAADTHHRCIIGERISRGVFR